PAVTADRLRATCRQLGGRSRSPPHPHEPPAGLVMRTRVRKAANPAYVVARSRAAAAEGRTRHANPTAISQPARTRTAANDDGRPAACSALAVGPGRMALATPAQARIPAVRNSR